MVWHFLVVGHLSVWQRSLVGVASYAAAAVDDRRVVSQCYGLVSALCFALNSYQRYFEESTKGRASIRPSRICAPICWIPTTNLSKSPRHVQDPPVVAGTVPVVQQTVAVKERVVMLELQQALPILPVRAFFLRFL